MLNACSAHKEISVKTEIEDIQAIEQVLDLQIIPQDVAVYSQGIDREPLSLTEFQKEYFRVWNIEKMSINLEDAMWAYKLFNSKNSYAENLQPTGEEFFDNTLDNSNFGEYASLNKRALSLDLLNIRAFPTNKPVLRDPSKAGEGFPFDYMQNSTIAPNKPLFLSHYSKDKKWAFVESSFAFGWVKVKDIVLIEKKYTDYWQKAQQIFTLKDNVPIYSQSDKFLFYSRVGMMLALIEENENSYRVLTVTKDENGEAIYLRSDISKENSNSGVLSFNTENINRIISELATSNYGWGGMYKQRDCSSTLRDFYAPFGLWLPRNSYAQSRKGYKLSLENLSDEEKIEKIKQNAIPFETLLYKQGHIVLYVGTFNAEVVVFQNVWGVKTKRNKQAGRYIIGKSIFSTLELGKNLKEYDESGSLLRNLQSLNYPMK